MWELNPHALIYKPQFLNHYAFTGKKEQEMGRKEKGREIKEKGMGITEMDGGKVKGT